MLWVIIWVSSSIKGLHLRTCWKKGVRLWLMVTPMATWNFGRTAPLRVLGWMEHNCWTLLTRNLLEGFQRSFNISHRVLGWTWLTRVVLITEGDGLISRLPTLGMAGSWHWWGKKRILICMAYRGWCLPCGGFMIMYYSSYCTIELALWGNLSNPCVVWLWNFLSVGKFHRT